jgi:hypothetical protein
MYGQSFPVWALGVTALSVAITWLYAHTNESLLLVMVMHSAVNPFALSPSLVAWLTAAFLWVTAVYILVRMPRPNRSAPEKQRATIRRSPRDSSRVTGNLEIIHLDD